MRGNKMDIEELCGLVEDTAEELMKGKTQKEVVTKLEEEYHIYRRESEAIYYAAHNSMARGVRIFKNRVYASFA